MKKNNWFWVVLVVVYLAISSVIAFIGYLYIDFWAVVIGLIVFGTALYQSFSDGRAEIPHNHVGLFMWYSEYTGDRNVDQDDDNGVFGPGLYYLFPYFNVCQFHNNIAYFLGESQVKLFTNEKKLIDFRDGLSASLDVDLFFYIVDARKAAFCIDGYLEKIVKRVESALRVIISQETFDEANSKKLKYVLGTARPGTDEISVISDDEIKEILGGTGVRLSGVVLSDIKLSQAFLALRQKKFEELIKAGYAVEVATEEAKKRAIDANSKKDEKITLSMGDAKAIENVAKAENAKIDQLIKILGLSRQEAIDYILTNKKWDSVKDTDKMIIDGGGNSDVSFGAKFGVGQGFAGSQKPTNQTPANQVPATQQAPVKKVFTRKP